MLALAALTELVGLPKVTLGGANDDEIIGNLMRLIGIGLVLVIGLYVLARLYLPVALRRKQERLATRSARQDAVKEQ